MSKLKFAGRIYCSILDRNRDAYNNSSYLTRTLKIKKNKRTLDGSLVALALGLVAGLVYLNWSVAIIVAIFFAVLFSMIVHLFIESQIDLVSEYAEDYSEKIISLQKELKNEVFDPFLKRYVTSEQIDENIPDLVNLINHRKELNLIDEDIGLMMR